MDPQIDVKTGDVLIIMDMQNCFLPGGSLPVTEGDRIIGPLNAALDVFARAGLPVIFTRGTKKLKRSSGRLLPSEYN